MGDIHEIINIELPSQSARVQRGGEGPPLLFLHAEANTSAWSNFHDELAENFEVFAPIHPGFGGEETRNRFYVLHCIAIPLGAALLIAIHFWRVRKDGGISGPL